jgi:hypothetical protein
VIGRGSLDGQCEVLPDKACIWVNVYEHARAANRVDGLIVFIPPRNRDLQDTSSFINLFLNRDSRPGAWIRPSIQIPPHARTTSYQLRSRSAGNRAGGSIWAAAHGHGRTQLSGSSGSLTASDFSSGSRSRQ